MNTTSQTTPHKVRQIRVEPQHEGQRLDNFLMRELKGVSKNLVYRIVRRGEVRVNGGRAKPAQRLMADDIIRIPPVNTHQIPKEPKELPDKLLSSIESAILHEDDDLMVVNKPPGLAVHGGSGLSYGLIEALRASRPHAPFLELVHRLDRDTSGLLLIAKSRLCLNRLHSLLRDEGMDKRYLALLHGRWEGGERVVDLPLSRNKTSHSGLRQVAVDEEGSLAYSRFKPVKRLPRHTLVEVSIGTGRTHQIRVHAASIGHPIVGDTRYGDFAADRLNKAHGLKRQFLHAAELRFRMPETGQRFHFKAPLPDDLQTYLNHLEKE